MSYSRCLPCLLCGRDRTLTLHHHNSQSIMTANSKEWIHYSTAALMVVKKIIEKYNQMQVT